MASSIARASQEWSMPATAENVSRARRAVADHLVVYGVSDDVLDAVRVAVSEAITNVVLHAYVEAAEPGSFRVEAGVNRGEVCITVSDDGRGMVPRHDSPGAGLGLAIIAQLAAEVEIGHSQTDGTRIRMTFSG